MTAKAAVARLLAGADPSPRWWRRAQEMAGEIVTEMENRHVPMTHEATLPARAVERRPCVGCGELIARGQAYVVDGPYHIRCEGN